MSLWGKTDTNTDTNTDKTTTTCSSGSFNSFEPAANP